MMRYFEASRTIVAGTRCCSRPAKLSRPPLNDPADDVDLGAVRMGTPSRGAQRPVIRQLGGIWPKRESRESWRDGTARPHMRHPCHTTSAVGSCHKLGGCMRPKQRETWDERDRAGEARDMGRWGRWDNSSGHSPLDPQPIRHSPSAFAIRLSCSGSFLFKQTLPPPGAFRPSISIFPTAL